MTSLLLTALLATPAAQAKSKNKSSAPGKVLALRILGDAAEWQTAPLGSGAGHHPDRANRTNVCPDHRRALSFYRLRQNYWASLRSDHERTLKISDLEQPRGCAYTLWLVGVWKKRAYKARAAYTQWLKSRLVLHDFAFGAGNNAWLRAVREVQKVFPGTEGWLLSCSGAEGGHGRWVGFGGQGYSAWLRDSDTVGGPLQFRWSTFKGMYRHALDHVRHRGYKVPAHLRDPANDITWRSALGQAMAGGWARYTGNDDSHWSASWGRGC